MAQNSIQKLQLLEEKGVVIIDPRQVYIAPEVDIERIYAGSVLYPGTRLTGDKTLIGSYAKIGTEGPAVIHNSIIGSKAEVASGYLDGATLLSEAKAGANAHYRPGTLLEEHASTAHCVGLKQSILMYSVTLGSLINLCDVLISGGKSRAEHTEIGSGFIHFNFTPWGVNGDKATPTIAGTVTEGVFLDQKKIFLGGLSGMVGPLSIGFGAMTVAGQVVRHSVEDNKMHADVVKPFDKEWSPTEVTFSEKRIANIRSKNLEFITQLYVLKEWYRKIRLRRSIIQKDEELSCILEGAIATIQSGIDERVKRYNKFAKEWSRDLVNEINWDESLVEMEVTLDWKQDVPYDEWVKGLADKEKEQLHGWLCKNAEAMRMKLDL